MPHVLDAPCWNQRAQVRHATSRRNWCKISMFCFLPMSFLADLFVADLFLADLFLADCSRDKANHL